jgi:hypothetical protein
MTHPRPFGLPRGHGDLLKPGFTPLNRASSFWNIAIRIEVGEQQLLR